MISSEKVLDARELPRPSPVGAGSDLAGRRRPAAGENRSSFVAKYFVINLVAEAEIRESVITQTAWVKTLMFERSHRVTHRGVIGVNTYVL